MYGAQYHNPLLRLRCPAAEEVLSSYGFTLSLSNSYERADREAELLSFLRRRRVDGVIASISSGPDQNVIQAIHALGVPVVMLHNSPPLPVDSVSTAYDGGLNQALKHLIALGHQRVGIAVGRTGFSIEGRAQAFEDLYGSYHLAYDPALVHFCSVSLELPFVRTREMMLSDQPPTAIICGSSQLPSVLRAIKELSLSILNDILVISLGENDFATLYDPAITTTRWDYAEVGRTAARLLIERMLKRGSAELIAHRVPSELLVRGSTAPAKKHRIPKGRMPTHKVAASSSK